jgi:hypothetical protein
VIAVPQGVILQKSALFQPLAAKPFFFISKWQKPSFCGRLHLGYITQAHASFAQIPIFGWFKHV